MRATRRRRSAASAPACAAAPRRSTVRAALVRQCRRGRRVRRQGRRASPRWKPAARRSTSCSRGRRPGWYHPGRSGTIKLGPKTGARHVRRVPSEDAGTLDVVGPLCGFECLSTPSPSRRPSRRAPSRGSTCRAFQAVKRDFAFVVDARSRPGTILRRRRRRQEADRRRQRLRRVRGRVARRRTRSRSPSRSPSSRRQDADRRGFRGAGRADRRQRQEADGRGAEVRNRSATSRQR
jgi:hypothetical protein